MSGKDRQPASIGRRSAGPALFGFVLLAVGLGQWLASPPGRAGTSGVQQAIHATLNARAISGGGPVIAQDVCSAAVSPDAWATFPADLRANLRPLAPEAWAALSPNARAYLNGADAFTGGYIQGVLGEGPYPPCLYQSVRAYFLPQSVSDIGTPQSATDLKRAQARRDRALAVMRVVEETLK